MSMTKPKTPAAADLALGAKIRELRILRGMSQERLGETVGVTFQQIQKYEKGANRVSGSRITAIAAALAVQPGDLLNSASDIASGAAVAVPEMDAAIRDVAVLMMAQPPKVRGAIRTMVASVTSAIAEGAAQAAE